MKSDNRKERDHILDVDHLSTVSYTHLTLPTIA